MPQPVYWLIDAILGFYIFVVIITVILSWLINFNVVNRFNPVVNFLLQATSALTEPLLGPIRRRLPPLGGLDLSPIVLLLAVGFVMQVNTWLYTRIGF